MNYLNKKIIIGITLLFTNLAIAKPAIRYVCEDDMKQIKVSVNFLKNKGAFTVISPSKTYVGNINSSEITIKGTSYQGGTHEDFSKFEFNNNTIDFDMTLDSVKTNLNCERFQIDVKTKFCFRHVCDPGLTLTEYEVIEGYQCPQIRPIPCKG